ncbi:MAG: FmdB family zinc ribbon protein [Methanogenium sp.]|jgi:putative FmdB family regulatory protein
MPFYDYVCTDCKIIEEKHHKINSIEIFKCPKCGKQMKKMIGAPSLEFKGACWSKDGYTKSSEKK